MLIQKRGGVCVHDALRVRVRTEEVDATRRDEVLLGRGFESDGLRLAKAIVVRLKSKDTITVFG